MLSKSTSLFSPQPHPTRVFPTKTKISRLTKTNVNASVPIRSLLC